MTSRNNSRTDTQRSSFSQEKAFKMHPLLHLLVLLNVGFSLSNPVTTVVPTVPPNPCENKPCLNNGTCFFTAGSLQEDLTYLCTCSPGFTGMNCEFFIDPCTSKPCLHGNCTSSGSNEGYICVCEEGYLGERCDQPLHSNPVSGWTESLLPGLVSPTSGESLEPDTVSPPMQVAATLSPWQPKPGQKYVELSWTGKQLPLDFACGNTSSNGSAGGRSSSLEVPEETSVKIKVNVTGYPTLWKVTEAGFKQCSLTKGRSVPLLQILDGLVLSEEDLPVGNNYFIVFVNDSSKPVWTLHLNVSVKVSNCVEPGSNFNDPECSGKGMCTTESEKTTFYCECSRGFTGVFCEEFDACTENPCENNGTCTDVRQGDDGKNVICACQAGYRGSMCEEKIDPCASSPCQNNGSCYSNGLAYSCSCSPWYTGPTCAQLIDFCALNPCAHGICHSVGTSYKCLCIPGYHGLYCEEEYNECRSTPCQNSGTCKDLVNDYECLCTAEYEGKHCELYKDPCVHVNCQNGGTCDSEGLNATCLCPPGFFGEDCEVDVNECESNPCHHSGTCIDQSNGYTCHCPQGWVGANCEIHLQWKSARTTEPLTNMPRHSLYIIIGALCVAFVLMLIILIVGICRISRIEYQGSSRPAYEEFYNCRSIDSEFSSAIASIRHARFGKKSRPAMYDATPVTYEDYSPDDKPLVTLIKTKDL
ncbi:delta and Notch-like epidermal growth factor-related receptor [Polyodon spathula]|uniref:delta and Notch-like epidermal growth factor-related receptor n=1 Tax=Polyodon spathula TaxID=7913 RepID=UPI001B7F5CE4|nr:delta and Notch-like epidermal growth factor-related receptor [Polyodon spathula]